MRFSFGSDPEFILIDEKGNLKSAINVLKNKTNKIESKGNFFFYDNVLAECTIKPGFSKKEVIKNIKESLEECARLVRPLKISTVSSACFPQSELNHTDARKSGCEPEFCAYKLKKASSKKINKIFKESNLRSAGGHVHLGTDLGKSHETCVMLVRMLDLFLGVPTLALDPGFQRRKLYGQAGRYRQPKYGVEYRTLSNFWLSSPKLVEIIYDLCEIIIDLTHNKIYEKFWDVDYKSLESDEFWNSGGDPSSLHRCHGYDVHLLRKLFNVENIQIDKFTNEIDKLIYSFIPDSIRHKIKNFKNCNFDIYKEWAI